MKKTFASFFVLFVAALPAVAASTCETRVDRHQDATTRQRVAHCLTPEPEPPTPAGPELVYYGVSSTKPKEAVAKTTKPRKKTYFKKKDVAVSNDFVDTRNFPVFTNDSLSEQDRLALEEAQKKQILQDIQKTDKNTVKKEQTARAPRRLEEPTLAETLPAPETAVVAPKEATPAKEETPVQKVKPAKKTTSNVTLPLAEAPASKPASFSLEERLYERPTDAASYTELAERAALSPYSKKATGGKTVTQPTTRNVPTKTEPLLEEPQVDPEQPAVYAALKEAQSNFAARQHKPKRVMQETSLQPQTAPAAQPVQPVSVQPTDTPMAEIAQAQAIEADPLAQPEPTPYSMPEDFMDDDLLTGDESFGYNATDPALQP